MILRKILGIFQSRPMILYIAAALIIAAILWAILVALRPLPPRIVPALRL